MAKIRRYEEIMAGAIANMIAKQDKITDFNEGSIIHTILDTVARIAERAYVAIRQGYNEMLAILPYSPFKFTKKEGFYASGTVVFGRDGALGSQSIIPKGTVVSGGGFTFTTTEAGIIAADSLNSEPVTVVADGAGSDYNIAAGVISAIDSIVPADVVSVTNSSAFTGGTDEETDTEFEERFRTYINGLSGTNAYAIKSAALSVNAVRSVSIQNHKPPLKNIYNMSVYVDDGSGGASVETLDAVKLAIEGDNTEENPGHLAPGVNIRVITPTAVPVNVKMTVKIISTDTNEARTEIQNVVTAYVNSLTIGESCIISSIITKVMALNFVKDVAVTSPASNVEPAINQIARIGTVSITLTEVE